MYLATEKQLWRLTREFISSYQIKFPKACECLQKDKEVLFTFYDFPAQHWPHLRTINLIEIHPTWRTTVRLRTHRTKGYGSRIATLVLAQISKKVGARTRAPWEKGVTRLANRA